MSSSTPDVEYHLVGSHIRYSSWTARIVLLLEYFKIPHKTTTISVVLNKAAVLPYSPTGLVPVLIVNSPDSPQLTITETIAIAEYLAETHPDLPLWPRDAHLRALARSAAAEMHAGFSTMRNTYSSNFLGQYNGPVPIDVKGKKDIERMLQLWDQSRQATVRRLKELGTEDEDEGWLFGKFGIADSFFWPVLWRFRTYNLPLTGATPEALAWMRKMWDDKTLKRLGDDTFKQLDDPQSFIPQYEDIFKDVPGVTYGRVARDWKLAV